jgi:hypothetical protein
VVEDGLDTGSRDTLAVPDIANVADGIVDGLAGMTVDDGGEEMFTLTQAEEYQA